MATFNIQHSWKQRQAMAVNVSTDTFVMFLADDTPAAADDQKADTTPITEQFGYTEYTMTISWYDGTTYWSLRNNADKTWTASGGAIPQFRYVWIDDSTANYLVGYWDVGAETNITSGNSFLVDLDASYAIYDLS